MSNDSGHPGLSAKENNGAPGGYIEPGENEEERRAYEKPVTQKKPVPAKETQTVKKEP